jgi:hypothetical protein
MLVDMVLIVGMLEWLNFVTEQTLIFIFTISVFLTFCKCVHLLQLLHSLDEDDRSQGPVDSPTLSRAVKDVSHHISQVSVYGWV